MKTFTTKDKATIWVSFKGSPQVFRVYNNDLPTQNKLYFFRVLHGKYTTIKFNVERAGTYHTNEDCTTIQVLPLTIHPIQTPLPPHERELMKPFKVVYNPNLSYTPARNFTATGIIETGPKFKALPFPIQQFILRHEEGHFYYEDEIKADMYAAHKYINDGFNNSCAYYSLSEVLHPNDQNLKRIKQLFNILHR